MSSSCPCIRALQCILKRILSRAIVYRAPLAPRDRQCGTRTEAVPRRQQGGSKRQPKQSQQRKQQQQQQNEEDESELRRGVRAQTCVPRQSRDYFGFPGRADTLPPPGIDSSVNLSDSFVNSLERPLTVPRGTKIPPRPRDRKAPDNCAREDEQAPHAHWRPRSMSVPARRPAPADA